MYSQNLLMVRPIGFRVEYAINPYMKDTAGRLQQVNYDLALQEWEALRGKFTELGCKVEVIEGDPAFPDMVFCANQTFPFLSKKGKPSILLSRMRSEHRRGEVKHFRAWAEEKNFELFEMTDFDFEGCGDAIWNYETGELFGGYGFRTQPKAYDLLEKSIDGPLIRLELTDPCFYHMDTCFSILNGDTVAIVKEAFTENSLALIDSRFKNVIEVDREEAVNNFAANCLSLNGRDIVVPEGAKKFVSDLETQGFNVHEVKTTEFIKSGGSVFCMKQILF